jgi:hypothetical protein
MAGVLDQLAMATLSRFRKDHAIWQNGIYDSNSGIMRQPPCFAISTTFACSPPSRARVQ